MFKKILILMVTIPFLLIAQEGFSKRGHEKRHEKAREKIERQHQRKTERLEQWKTKRLEKCGTNQGCINRVNHQAGKKAIQIDKQYEKRKSAFEQHEEKHPVETPETEEPKTEEPQTEAAPAAPSSGNSGGAPMTESR